MVLIDPCSRAQRLMSLEKRTSNLPAEHPQNDFVCLLAIPKTQGSLAVNHPAVSAFNTITTNILPEKPKEWTPCFLPMLKQTNRVS